MKTLKLLTICCLLLLGANTIAQNGGSSSYFTIELENIKNHPDLSPAFKQKAIAVAKLGDHLPPKSLLQFEIQMARNTITAYEKAVLNGAGKNVILPKAVKNARKMHPGMDKPALSSRLRMYLKQMERVFEDDE